MKVLVVKTSSLGDVIHTLPALTDAMTAIPGIRFDWVVEEAFAEIPSWHPAVDRVIPFALRRWRKSPLQAMRSGQWSAYCKALRATQYDAVIDAQGLLKSAALVTRLARGPRYGLDGASARERLSSFLYSHRIAVARPQHAVERVRQLFATALGYELPAKRGDFSIARHFPSRKASPALVFLHATTWHAKHWPEPSWTALAGLAAQNGLQVRLFWNTPAELERARRLESLSSNVVVLPRMTLSEVAAELILAQGIVSVDTGLSHLAAALDRPNVVLFGPTDPGLVGGYGANQVCLQAKDFPPPAMALDPPDLAAITPAIVWDRLSALLGIAQTDQP